MQISTRDPQTILAIMIMIGMILGPWILHERTLSRVEYRMEDVDRKVAELDRRAARNDARLDERKKTFEDTMNDLRDELKRLHNQKTPQE